MRELKSVMRVKIAWLLILAYALVLVKPVMPVIADAAAHAMWESRHIATVHEEHGKFHLHYEVLQSNAGSEKEKHAPVYKSMIADDLFILPVQGVQLRLFAPRLIHHSGRSAIAALYEPIARYQPPKV